MANMKLYMAPGSCTTAIHIILEELEAVFEAHVVSLPAGDHFKPDYVAINPKSTIPTLVRPDGTALTEVPAIAFWLGRNHPRARLWPKDPELETRALELMTYVAGTVHGQGFARIFAPNAFCQDAEKHEEIQAYGRSLVEKCFSILDSQIPPHGYSLGDYSVVDPVLFYVEFWADKTGIPLPQNLADHYRRMLTRRAVDQVLREEGYRPEKLAAGFQDA